MNTTLRSSRLACLVVLAAGVLFLNPLPGFGKDSERTNKPNIVFILADDIEMRCLGCYGNTEIKTPHLDALAKEGLRFNHCYSTPLCIPTRVEILTGKYNHRNFLGQGKLRKGVTTFAHILRAQGYKTCLAGKWQIGVRKGQEIPEAGFDQWCVTEVGGAPGGFYHDPGINENGNHQQRKGEYGPDVCTNYLLEFIEKNRARPFLAYYATHLPHDPMHVPPGYEPKDEKSVDNLYRYTSMINQMDKCIGRIVAQLDKLNLRENTIILYTGDNGTPQGIRFPYKDTIIQGGKGKMQDIGTRVGMIASWKGRSPENKLVEDLVDFSDFYATFAEAAGLDPRKLKGIDGVSFLPQLQGQKGTPREWAFLFSVGNRGGAKGYWARDQRWKLDHKGSLYDMLADCQEERPIKKEDDNAENASARRKLAAVFKKVNVTREQLKVKDVAPAPWLKK